jgi:hypothetical protein
MFNLARSFPAFAAPRSAKNRGLRPAAMKPPRLQGVGVVNAPVGKMPSIAGRQLRTEES